MVMIVLLSLAVSAKINGGQEEELRAQDNNFGMKMNAKVEQQQQKKPSNLIWDLDSLHPLLRAGIILNMRIAEERKAKGLDMPPRFVCRFFVCLL